MNQEKIGRYIALCRKEQNLTQEELGSKVGVGYKAVSRWETGNGLPDVSIMQPLCNILKISVTELLNGEKTKDESKKDTAVVDYLKYQKLKNKKNIFLTVLGSILIIFVGCLLCYFINNYGKVEVYRLNGESDLFEYSDALFLKSNMKHIFVDGTITTKDGNIHDDDIISVSLKNNEELIKSNTGIKHQVNIEKYGYGEYFSKNAINNIDSWVIEVKYMDSNDSEKTDIIKLKNELILKNDRLINKINQEISSNDEGARKEIKDIQDARIKKMNSIVEKFNFEEEPDNSTLYYKKISKNETFFIRKDASEVIYYCPEYNVISEFTGTSHLFRYNKKDYSFFYDPSTDKIECNSKQCPNDVYEIAKSYVDLFEKYFA
ncbi:MAG: helix-turn-helix transcriptional regulator [Firmicutes bacterium]|jgi:transcriptional regulator with XRE-family HTH domain|nr:helix-turn-helix transcriptional regulator [Bacillota bacterium]